MNRLRAFVVCGLIVFSSITSAREASGRQQSINRLLPDLTQYVKDGMAKTHVPGVAVGVVYQDQVIYLRGFGVRMAGTSAPITPETVFQLASVSKPIASTVVASAVSDGLVGWDERIIELDPDFRLSDRTVESEVTVRDMLSHRSGLPASAGDVLEELGFSRPEILSRMRLLPLTGQLHKTYEYSNFPYTEGGLASVARSRQTWEQYAERHIFRPLGMTSTTYRWSNFAGRANKSSLHVLIDGQAEPRYQRTDTDAEAPAGGASSNVRDMAQWLRLHLSNGRIDGSQIVDPRALAETHKEQIVIGKNQTTGGPAYYGLGWNVDYDAAGNRVLSHSGAFRSGAGTSVMLQPSLRLGIVVLTNAQPTGLAEATTHYLFDLVKQGVPEKDWLQYYGNIYSGLIRQLDGSPVDYLHKDPPSSPAPSQPFNSYAGRYQNSYYGQIEVFAERGQLYLRLPARSSLYALQHWDGDTFTFRYEAEGGLGLRGLQFNYQGRQQLIIDKLAVEGNGVFTKLSE